ncbi:hypothetical protein [Stratiformator vulcanicus]|uniref:Uncharacterized protein n=1 Tax=Stratiformator vulcanicus TaxID=2527980 RepID=A0A517R2X6_9PLAN|nr:hypothetical protein [Stratiformator vulcanicus]QDT38214.1 hypothetical protein Pan189_26040 [Stratiformator vulcanicus]
MQTAAQERRELEKRVLSNPLWVRCRRLLQDSPRPLRGRRQELVRSIKADIEDRPDLPISADKAKAVETLFRQVFG